MPCGIEDEMGYDKPVWTFPANGEAGKTVRLNQYQNIQLTNNPDQTLHQLSSLLRPGKMICNAAIDRLCRYFYHEIKVQKNKIDDYEEFIRARKADVRNLQKGCRLKITKRQAEHKLNVYGDAIRGCRATRDKYMAMNRRLRNRVPLEKHVTLPADDGAIIMVE